MIDCRDAHGPPLAVSATSGFSAPIAFFAAMPAP